MSPLGEVMYGIVNLENSDSQLVLPATYGLGFSR